MSETPIFDKDEPVIINTGRPSVNTKRAENEAMQMDGKQLPGIIPPINPAQITSSNIPENTRNAIVQNCETCSPKTDTVNTTTIYVAPIQTSCEANHQYSKLENSRPQYQKVHSHTDSQPRGYELQNAKINVLENDRNFMSSSNTPFYGNKNMRKRTVSQMNETQNLDSLSLEDSYSPVRKKRPLNLNEFSENGSSLYEFSQHRNLSFKTSPSSQNNGILSTNESYGSLAPGNQSENLSLTPSSKAQNDRIWPTNESYGSLAPINQSENLSLTPSSKALNDRIWPTNESYGSLVSGNQPQKSSVILPDNHWTLMANNRNLPENRSSWRESLVQENYPCSPFLQNSQSEISKNKIQPQSNLPHSSNLPYIRDRNRNLKTLNSGISSTNSWFKDNKIGIDSETSSPEMINFRNTNRMIFEEKMECHHFSSFSSFGNLSYEVAYRQKIVRSTYVSYHSQGAKESTVETSDPWVPDNTKYGSGIQHWSAVNADVTKSCMDFIGGNSRQTGTFPKANANANKAAYHMDWADDNTCHIGGLPAVNEDMTKSHMEWIEEDSRQGSVLPIENLDKEAFHMYWIDDNPHQEARPSEVDAEMANSCMDWTEDNSRQAALLPTINTNNTAFGMDSIGNHSRRVAGCPSMNSSEISSPMDWIENIEGKKKSRKRKK